MRDPDRGPVEAGGVAAAGAGGGELEDPAGGGDHEVGADVGQLVQLDVGDVGREGVVDGGRGAGLGDVLDDHVRVAQPPLAVAVVAQRVGGHLAPAFGAEGN